MALSNIDAFTIAGNRTCFCGAELVVKQTAKGYYLECTDKHIAHGIEGTKKRAPSAYEQRLIEDKTMPRERAKIELEGLF